MTYKNTTSKESTSEVWGRIIYQLWTAQRRRSQTDKSD